MQGLQNGECLVVRVCDLNVQWKVAQVGSLPSRTVIVVHCLPTSTLHRLMMSFHVTSNQGALFLPSLMTGETTLWLLH